MRVKHRTGGSYGDQVVARLGGVRRVLLAVAAVEAAVVAALAPIAAGVAWWVVWPR